MPEWIPTRSSTKGRLVLTAVEYFAAHDYDDVSVADLAAAAGVTTGSLYHHFANKLELYDVVRTDIERRVLDRIQGAVAARPNEPGVASALAGLLVCFDFLVEQNFARILCDQHPGRLRPDPIQAYIATLTDRHGVPLSAVLVAAWRAALDAAAHGTAARQARVALSSLHVTT